MANPHSGHKRGFGSTAVILVLLIAGIGTAIHYFSPVQSTYRATWAAEGATHAEIEAKGEALFVRRGDALHLRIETRREYPIIGAMEWTETWTRARLTQLRADHPELAALDVWPEPATSHGGVVWIAE